MIILEIMGLTIAPSFHMVTKPMIMATLLGFYITVTPKQSNILLMAMILALLGDCFSLNYASLDFVAISLFCYLFMHILYGLEFNTKRRIGISRVLTLPMVIGLLAMAYVGTFWSDFVGMKFSVVLFTLASIFAIVTAYFRHPKLRGYKEVLFGILLFLLNSGLVAWVCFRNGFPYQEIFIMITYMISQYFIVTGIVLGNTPRKSKSKPKRNSNFAIYKDKS